MKRALLIALCAVASGCWQSVAIYQDGLDSDADSDSDGDSDTEQDTADCFDGDFTITDEADVATLAPYPCITGSLSVDCFTLISLELPNLEWIGGELMIQDNDALEDFEMGGLTTIAALRRFRAS